MLRGTNIDYWCTRSVFLKMETITGTRHIHISFLMSTLSTSMPVSKQAQKAVSMTCTVVLVVGLTYYYSISITNSNTINTSTVVNKYQSPGR